MEIIYGYNTRLDCEIEGTEEPRLSSVCACGVEIIQYLHEETKRRIFDLVVEELELCEEEARAANRYDDLNLPAHIRMSRGMIA